MASDATGKAIATIGPRRLAEAITAPSSLLAAGATAGLAVAATGPIGLLAGVVVWLAMTGFRLRPKTASQVARQARERIDPFTLAEPWRRYVQSAQESQRRFDDTVRSTPMGPVRDQLEGLRENVAGAVDDCWQTSKRGAQLVRAYQQVDVERAQRELDEAQQLAQSAGGSARAESLKTTVESLQTQIATAERLRSGATNAQDRLRALDAQLDEIVARTVELSATADSVGVLDDLGADLDRVRMEMEAVRQGLEEASQVERAALGNG